MSFNLIGALEELKQRYTTKFTLKEDVDYKDDGNWGTIVEENSDEDSDETNTAKTETNTSTDKEVTYFMVKHWNILVPKHYQFFADADKDNVYSFAEFFRHLGNISVNLLKYNRLYDSEFHDSLMDLVNLTSHLTKESDVVVKYRDMIEKELWEHKSSTIGWLGMIQPFDYMIIILLMFLAQGIIHELS